MLSETLKPTHHSPSEGEKHPRTKEVRDMVNAIAGSMTDLYKIGSSLHNEDDDDDDDHGVKVITLAGTNTGASMRSELDDKQDVHQGFSHGEGEPMNTYVNSNFQSVNNSIMFSSNYNTNDPGVHMDITDVFEHQGHHKPDKHAKKGKKKGKEALKSDQQTEQSN